MIPENVVISGVKYPVKRIDSNAFADCPELVSVHIPKTVSDISSYRSFCQSPKLKEITVDKENKSYWSYDGCLYDITGQYALVAEGKDIILNAVPEGKEGILEIPESVTCANLTFSMPRITAIKIPSTFMPVGTAALNGPLLKSFEVSEKNPWLESRDGVLIQKKRLEKNEVSNPVYESTTVQKVPAILNFPSGKTVNQYTIPSDIVSLACMAFSQCNNIEEVTIPENVIELEDDSLFYGVFNECANLSRVNLPTTGNFKNAIPIFSNTPKLKSINIPSGLKIDPKALNHSNLEEVNIEAGHPEYSSSDGVVYLENSTKLYMVPQGKTGNLTIPEHTTTIMEKAFEYCRNLDNVTVPGSIKIISAGAFSGAKYDSGAKFGHLALLGESPALIQAGESGKTSPQLSGLSPSTIIVVDSKFIMKSHCQKWNYYMSMIKTFNTPYYITNITALISGVKFKLEKNPYYIGDETDYPLIALFYNNITQELQADKDGYYRFFEMEPQQEGRLWLSCKNWEEEETFRTQKNPIHYRVKTRGQTKIHFYDIGCDTDESTGELVDIVFYGKKLKDETELLVEDLTPSTRHDFEINATTRKGNIVKTFYTTSYVNTRDIKINFTYSNVGPTTGTITANVDCDGKLRKAEFKGFPGKGLSISLSGLVPNSMPTYDFEVITERGYTKKETAQLELHDLVLTTLVPKCVASTVAIVAAETNIADSETNVGFQWKKYGAPESLAPNEAFAPVIDGKVEGRLMNLQPTHYYNVRAFYKSESGTYHYSDWVTFDPSDFSWFEPTIHTYPIETVDPTSAHVRAYALAGSDDIIEQGVEYWKNTAPRNGQRHAPETPSNVMSVTGTGQVMNVVLTNLEPNTEYICRAYIITEKGTYYGENQYFATSPATSGIGNILIDDAGNLDDTVTVTGYFDISGKRYSVPQHGFNIIHYSDGSVRKVIFK